MGFEGVEEFPAGAAQTERGRRLRRGIFLLPGLLTVANLFCGYYAVVATLDGTAAQLVNAARAIGIAIFFDVFDGRVARATHTASDFGKEFDSLADVISFGIAPAFLAYAWGVRGAPASDISRAFHLVQLGWSISFFFAVCCAWRLARFNIQGMARGGGSQFVGMPTPAAAGMVAAMVYAIQSPIQSATLSVLWLALLFLLALLMPSRIRYASFKETAWTKNHPSVLVLAIASLLMLLAFHTRITLLALASVYVFHGPILHLMRGLRRKQPVLPS